MIKKIAHGLAQKMNKIYPRGDEDSIKMEYFLEAILDQFSILIVAFIFCAVVGYHKEALICFIACMIYRAFAGGLHFKKKLYCLVMTSSIAVVGGLIVYKVSIPFYVCILLLAIDLVLAILFAPQATKNNPIAENAKKIRKIESCILICIYLTVLILFKGTLGEGLAVGASIGTLTILPVFMKLTA